MDTLTGQSQKNVNTKQISQSDIEHHELIATQAMLLSIMEETSGIVYHNDEDNRSYILGYN